MIKILDASGVKYSFMDEQGGVCCGRPLMLAGQDKEARELINFNSQMIWKSGAHTLVTSCPICYKVFKESYYLDVEVLHHTQFIKRLIDEGSVKMNSYTRKLSIILLVSLEEDQVYMMNQKMFYIMFPDLRNAISKMKTHYAAEEVWLI